ncbi:hypothetical protein RAS1_17370 [Phycisphaerae bacterium RAS1]|nr:hypothetical protein RAS1_17370 [Phycisphaerae bacterium RAS1]
MLKNPIDPHWQLSPKADEFVQSACTVVRAALSLPICPEHRDQLIDWALWKVTEAGEKSNDKYNTRYCSFMALRATNWKPQHEHVFTKKSLRDAILQRPADHERIMRTAVGCVVTVDEHRLLSKQKEHQGWARCAAAGVRVWDRLEGREMKFNEPES